MADEVRTAVDAALDRPVTLSIEGTERTVTPRELGVTPNGQALLDAGVPRRPTWRSPSPTTPSTRSSTRSSNPTRWLPMTRSWPGAWPGASLHPGDTGLAVDHQDAIARLQAALQGQADRVDLELHTTQPDITTADFDEVLLVRQGDRQVDLVRNGTTVRTWNVAVGTSGHATPTGLFTIGVKRFERPGTTPRPTGGARTCRSKSVPGRTTRSG